MLETAAEHVAMLHEVVDEVRVAHPGLRIRSRVIRGSPVRALLDASEHASVVALGRHRRWSSASSLLGSVPHAVLLGSRAPVLVVGWQDVPAADRSPRSGPGHEAPLLVR